MLYQFRQSGTSQRVTLSGISPQLVYLNNSRRARFGEPASPERAAESGQPEWNATITPERRQLGRFEDRTRPVAGWNAHRRDPGPE